MTQRPQAATNFVIAATGQPRQTRNTVRGITRIAYWVLAGFFFLLAMVGVVLPGIPTTPFLLLMCYFLVRVSPELHAHVLAWPVVGRPLRDWREHNGVRRNVKFIACTMVVLLIGSTLLRGGLPPAANLLILCSGLYGMSVVLRLPTVDGRRRQENLDNCGKPLRQDYQ